MRTRLPAVLGYLFGAIAALAAGLPTPALAAACGTGLNPVVVSASAVAFGIYDPVAASPTTTNGTVTVACLTVLSSTLPSFTVALSGGTTSQFNPRQLSFGGARLNYNLYTTASYATVWGNGTGATATQSYNASLALSQTTFTAYGRLPAGQFAPPGGYTDLITVTVTY
jgi:spore coat protein U-like protein